MGPDPLDLLPIAFGDRPAADLSYSVSDHPRRRWLAAVVLGGRGRYAAAATLLDGLVSGVGETSPTDVAAHAAVTRAAQLRQLGGHRAARRWDGLGLRLATAARPAEVTRVTTGPGLDLSAAAVDALLGLAADALGAGEPAVARRLLEAARRPASRHPSWRPGLRWYWVAAELALAQGRGADALRFAEPARIRAVEARAVRHQIKSELVWLVALAGVEPGHSRLATEATELADRARAALLPSLEWPARLVSAQLGSPGQAAIARRILADIDRAADPRGRLIARHSPWVPDLT